MAEKGKILIVESPTKAKIISKFLSGYKVLSSKGHIKDLPENELGVDEHNNFKPTYVIIPGKEKIVERLRTATKHAKEVIIATDPDREGEAIAYHIAEEIKRPIHRVLFYEITPQSVRKAIKERLDIDMNKVHSQLARRILDRLVGYKVSPLLWKIIGSGLSAGRVQSVALRLICEREEAIRKFKPREYWEIYVKFTCEVGSFMAKLEEIGGKKAKIESEHDAIDIVDKIRGAKFYVSEFKIYDKKRYPHPPYVTSALQEDAAHMLKFAPSYTMRIAQKLFEGIEMDDEAEGLITYMRTDSVRVSRHAQLEAREYIKRMWGDEFLPGSPPKYKEKAKIVQGAHEAIRPTKVSREPDNVKRYLSEDEYKLYKLIWCRFVASQMNPAIYEVREATIEGDGFTMRASSQAIKFEGFLKVWDEKTKAGESLPTLTPGMELNVEAIYKKRKFTQPPPRYTEGSMVKELERLGIGRPSTYAIIISTLKDRKYVVKRRGYLIPTDLGERVNRILVKYFADIFNVEFTRNMEKQLDEIEANKVDYLQVLQAFYRPFKKEVEEVEKHKKEIRATIKERRDESCPICGAQLTVRYGKFGRFLACSRFPKCKYTRPYPTGVRCPNCGGMLVERMDKQGRLLYVCDNPNCHFMLRDKPINMKCNKCGYPILLDKVKYYECPRCKTKIYFKNGDTS